MTAVDNLTAKVAELVSVVNTLSTNVQAETATLAAQHAELLTALQSVGVNDPAIQAAADGISAQITALQGVADAAAKAVSDNPDPATPAPTPTPAA